MRKLVVALLSLGLLVVLLVPAVTLADSGEVVRVIVRTDDSNLRESLKTSMNVRHDFGSLGFTAEMLERRIPMMEAYLGVDIEEVEVYQISKPPGGCDPWPDCNKGGGSGGDRTQYPSDQTPWGIEMMYNDPGISATSGGAGVDVAVLDTGVAKNHLDLSGRVEQCVDFTGKSRPGTLPIKVGQCNDDNGHGTHVAGSILADGGSDGLGIFGVAPEADLFAYKVCGKNGCWNDDIAVAIKYAADQGAEIISMSFGADGESSLIRDAISYAVDNGVLLVAAAGNDGPNYGSIDYPAANVNVIAVGAIDANKNVPSWSSRGVNDGDYVIEVREVEFGAPGVNVESTWNDGGYYFASGTSMATPHISGLVAKLWQGNAADTRTYLQSIASDIWTSGDDTATGWGLPQVP